MKKRHILSFLLFTILFVISFCKEDIYGNIKLSFTVGNYLEILKIDNLKFLLLSTFISFITIILLIAFLFPFVNYLINLKKRKQQIILLFVLLPICINTFYKDVSLIGINGLLGYFLNLMIILMPYLIIVMFFVSKNINNNEVSAAKDLGDNNVRIFKKIIWPKIKNITIYCLAFFTFFGSNIILLNKNNSVGAIIYSNINNHIHIPYVCTLLCLQFIVFALITRVGGNYAKKDN